MESLLSLSVVCGLLVLSQLSPGPDVFFVFRTASQITGCHLIGFRNLYDIYIRA